MTNIELVAVNAGINSITAYRLDTHETIVWQGKNKSKEYEMEQVIPGLDPFEFGTDPIVNAVEYKNRGDYIHAWEILWKILKQDLRCIDAHVHMGNSQALHRWCGAG